MQTAELSEQLLDELAAADAKRVSEVQRLLWRTWFFHEDLEARQLLAEGSELMDAADFSEARDRFLQAARLEPSWAEAWNRLATVDYLLGNYEDSLAEIDQTLELLPRHFGALSGRGLVFLKLERYREAVDAFQDAQELVPASEALQLNVDHAQAFADTWPR
ncbi:unnamed protein product [Effrenium voratum]|nr:unnamed protein product [Effrenium voratum]CAJ1441826.1 unnamed protein product [Effrenium voratum]